MADDVARLVATLEADISKFTKGMEQAQTIADQRLGIIEKRLKQTENVFSAGFGNITSLAAKFGVALSIASIGSFVKDVIDSTAALDGQAQKLGISTTALQAYHAGAVQAGSSIEASDAAIQRFTRSIGDAAESQGPARKAFQELGLTAGDLAGGTEAALPKVAAAILGIQDASTRARIEVALFGKSGQDTAEILKTWADPTLIQRMEDLGLVIDKSVIDRAQKAKTNWDLFWAGFRVQAAGALDVFNKLDASIDQKVSGKLNVDPRRVSQAPDFAHFTSAPTDIGGPGANANAEWKGVNKAFDDFIAKQVLATQLAAETAAQRLIDQRIIEAATARLKDQGKENEVTVNSLKQASDIIGQGAVAQITQISNQETINKLIGEGLDRLQQIKAAAGSVTWNQKFLDGLADTAKSDVARKVLDGVKEASAEQLKPDVRANATAQLISDLQEQADIARLLPQYRDAELIILNEQHNRNVDLDEDGKEQIRNAIELKQHNEDIVATIGEIQSSFQDFLKDAEINGKLSFGNLFRSILGSWLDLQNKMIAQSIFSGGGGGLLGGIPSIGGILGGIGSLLGFASGGSPPVGVPSIVGEKGPELFVPRVPGTIVPNNALGGGGIVQVELTIQPSGEFDARVMNTSTKAAVQVVTKYDRGLPRRVNQIASDPLKVR